MNRIYLILTLIVVFGCSPDKAEKSCPDNLSAIGPYSDKFSYYVDKNLRVTKVQVLNNTNEIISEDIYNTLNCYHDYVYVFKSNGDVRELFWGGSTPDGCGWVIDTDTWENYFYTWMPHVKDQNPVDCSWALQIQTSRGSNSDERPSSDAYTVTMNGNSLIMDNRTIFTGGESQTERTFLVID